MNPATGERPIGLGERLGYGLLALAAAAVALVYANRVFLDLPLYVGAESAHLIHALFTTTLADNPGLFQQLRNLDDTAYGLIVRALTYGTHHLLPWLRILGGAAYFAGLGLVFLSVRPSLERPAAVGILLLALAYPYYRFAVSALPHGWYVGVLGLIVFATAKLYLSRPIIHALVAGALSGVLLQLLPQGLAVSLAFLLLALADLLLGRRDLRVFLGRVVIFTTALIASINLLQLLAGEPVAPPASFYLADRYGALLTDSQARWIIGARTLVAMISACVMLAGVPAMTGLLRIEMRWRWSRGRTRFSLTPHETAFLLTLFSLAATIILTATLTLNGDSDPSRIWGRQFEALVPLLWLSAAPFIGEFERGGGRWWRTAMGLAPVVGLAGLTACLLDGVAARPWDAAALSAYSLNSPIAFAVTAILALGLGLATAFSSWPVTRIWLAGFIGLAVVSTASDVAWERSIAQDRAAMSRELYAAEAILAQRPGDVALVSDDPTAARLAYLQLRARPNTVLAKPEMSALDGTETLVTLGPGGAGAGWKPIFRGQTLSIFTRQTGIAATTGPTRADGRGIGSEPGSG